MATNPLKTLSSTPSVSSTMAKPYTGPSIGVNQPLQTTAPSPITGGAPIPAKQYGAQVPGFNNSNNAPIVSSPTVATSTTAPVINIPTQPIVKAAQITSPNIPPTPTISINTNTIPSSALGSGATASSVLQYRQQLQNQAEAIQAPSIYEQNVQQAQNALYGLQNNAVQAGIYSPQEIAAMQQVVQGNQAYRQGTLNIRGKVIPMEFQTGQQQQLDLQHSIDNQANTENAALQEQLRQNNLQAAQANAQFGQQNYQNAFGLLQNSQTNQIAQGQLGISQQTANIAALNSKYGRYDYQQVTGADGFPAIATIDKVTGQVVGTYSPMSSTGGISGTTSDPVQAFTNALIGQESGGNYNAVSPAGALGKYQIMPDTLKGLGINVSNQDYLNSPQLQDQAFQALLGQLSQQYNGDPIKMAAAYYGGAYGASVVGTPEGDKPQKGGFPSVNSYVNSVLQKTQAALTPAQTSQTSVQNLPPILQQYTIAGGVTGIPNSQYINLDKVPSKAIDGIKNLAAQNGVPVLNGDEVSKIQSIDVTKQNLTQMGATLEGLLGQGVVGRIVSGITNVINSKSQGNTAAATFNNYRTTAINQLQSLGAGSGGARITQAEIDTATDNLPTLTDNLETAKAKLNVVNSFLDKWVKEYIPNAQTGGQATATNSDPLGLGI